MATLAEIDHQLQAPGLSKSEWTRLKQAKAKLNEEAEYRADQQAGEEARRIADETQAATQAAHQARLDRLNGMIAKSDAVGALANEAANHIQEGLRLLSEVAAADPDNIIGVQALFDAFDQDRVEDVTRWRRGIVREKVSGWRGWLAALALKASQAAEAVRSAALEEVHGPAPKPAIVIPDPPQAQVIQVTSGAWTRWCDHRLKQARTRGGWFGDLSVTDLQREYYSKPDTIDAREFSLLASFIAEEGLYQ